VRGVAVAANPVRLGASVGQLDFVGDADRNTIKYSQDRYDGKDYLATLRFKGSKLVITEKHVEGVFGMGVAFAGEYRRAR
jgi:hypothetical protein